MKFDFNYFLDSFPILLRYLHLTLGMSAISMIIAILLGLGLALLSSSKSRVLIQFCSLYVSVFRGVPLLVQLFIFYYGLPQLFPQFSSMDAFTAAVLGLSLYNAAYLSEIFRSALNAIDLGQMEACLAVGMTKRQSLMRVIIPQAFRIAVPPMGNIYITILKETSLAFSLGVPEMFAQAKLMAGGSFKFLETYLAVGIIFWLIVVVFSYLQSKLEVRLSMPYR
ncbi:amino acid ABC transporter permease [Paenibacillus sanguinis]|uniref:amino acid ABC transporter permease n=1 Tax=Paenibacillus sanguinis TaxID=225906 RepID=UPI00037361E8|nr:amino acid ABC transporter permease [Paenibacillus sanguinis]